MTFGAIKSLPKSRLGALALVIGLLLTLPAAAQPSTVAAEVDVLPDAVVVYTDGSGPAWWKVTKGDSTVFILGLPPTKTLSDFRWDRRTLQRRLKGARLLLAPYTESSGFPEGAEPAVLRGEWDRRVRAALRRLGIRVREDRPVTVANLIQIRGAYVTRNRLTTHVHEEIYSDARRARVPIITPPVYRHIWDPAAIRPDDPEVAACFEAILKESEISNAQIKEASKYWAVGDVEKALAIAPKPYNNICHRLWPNHVERTIGFQTNAIAQSLEKPGKVIAVVYLYQLLGRNGILERLRAQGFEIADPAKPLTD